MLDKESMQTVSPFRLIEKEDETCASLVSTVETKVDFLFLPRIFDYRIILRHAVVNG